MSQYTCNNALGFELSKCTKPAQGQKNKQCKVQSAPNLHRDKKNKRFELQSAPNLHRDKKTSNVRFKVHQTCTGTKKTNVLNFKVHQTCTGTKKNFRGIVDSSQVDWLFFLFFLSLCRFGALWSSKAFAFFVPVQVLGTVLDFKVRQTCTGTKKTKVLKFKLHQTCTGAKKTKKTKTLQSTWGGVTIPLKFLFFLSLCRFGALWSSKLLFFLSLCRFGALWTLKRLFFLSLCRFRALSSSKLFFGPCAGLGALQA